MSKEIIAILSPVLGDELAADIVAHRKGLKCPLTPRGARSLLKQYEMTGNAVAAAEYQLNMGWRGFSHEWVNKKGSGFHDNHNPMPRGETAEERNRRIRLEDEMRWARNEGDTSKQARIKALLDQAVRH